MKKLTHNKPVSVFALFNQSLNLIRKNIQIYALVYAVPLFFTILSPMQEKDLSITSKTITTADSALVAIGAIVSLVLAVMAIGLNISTAMHKKTSFSELWDFARKYTFRLLGLWIITGLIVLGRLFLLIVPGLIFLQRYLLASYLMVDQDLGIIESLKKSAVLSKPFPGAIWGLIGVSILISIPSSPNFGVFGAIVGGLLGVAYAVAPALRYVELKKLSRV